MLLFIRTPVCFCTHSSKPSLFVPPKRVTHGVMARWLQTVVLVAIAALLANTQCYAQCLASVKSPPAAASAHSGCHHSSSKNGSRSQCNDKHQSNSAALETRVDLAKLDAVSLAPSAVLLLSLATASFSNHRLGSQILPEGLFPSDTPLFLVNSILRL